MFLFLKPALLSLALGMSLVNVTYAQSAPIENEGQAANAAATAAMQRGPSDISLGDQAVLKLPEGFGFIPKAEAARLMSAMGNQTSEGFMGLVVGEKFDGFVSVRYEKSGYIKDDDAKDWNADDLLQSLKEGTDEGNKDRAARGLPEMEIIGWVEKPGYQAATHRLVWSISSRDKGQAAGDSQGINYNTYVLGREGYLSLNLVTALEAIEKERPIAHELLAAVAFNKEKRYEDFNADTDHVAEYGLAALVGGLAVKKLGLLAMAGVFLLKMWKIVALAVFAIGAGVKKWLGRNKA
jgi:uncharacterized membrane-anchored protein